MWLVGVALNIVGSLTINLGVNCMKLGHNKQADAELSGNNRTHSDQSGEKISKRQNWFTRPGNRVWLLGMIGFVVCNALNFFSFGFAAIGILSALSSIQFISNVLFARFVNHELITWKTALFTLILTAGCVLLVVFVDHNSQAFTASELKELYKSPAYIAYLCCATVTTVVTYLIYKVGKRYHRYGCADIYVLYHQVVPLNYRLPHCSGNVGALYGLSNRWLPICYALGSGIIGTQSVLYGKSLSLLFRSSLAGQTEYQDWYSWLTLVLFLLSAVFWIRRFNKGIRMFPISLMMPVLQIVWVFFSMVAGSLYFQEFEGMDELQLGMFGLGTALLMAGLWLLTSSQAAKLRMAEDDCIKLEDILEAQYGPSFSMEEEIYREEEAQAEAHHKRWNTSDIYKLTDDEEPVELIIQGKSSSHPTWNSPASSSGHITHVGASAAGAIETRVQRRRTMAVAVVASTVDDGDVEKPQVPRAPVRRAYTFAGTFSAPL